MYFERANRSLGPSAALYWSTPYGATMYGVRSNNIGYVFCSLASFGTYTLVNSLTPSRIGTRYSYFV